MVKTHVPNRVREVRKALGLSLEEVASRVPRADGSDEHIAFATLAKIETGVQRLSDYYVDAISRALGVSPFELLPGAENLQMVPVIGVVAAGNWKEALEHSEGYVPVMAGLGGPRCFALKPDGDSMDKVVPDGAYIIVDPEQRTLISRKYYVIQNGEGDATFKQYLDGPPRLAPCSSNDTHEEMELGQEPFTVIGRVVGTSGAL